MEQLHIQHVTTAVFNPTANGACERLVGTLKRMIKKLIRDNSTAWPFVIPQARAAYMRRIHSATGFSPIQLAWLFLLYEVMGVVTIRKNAHDCERFC